MIALRGRSLNMKNWKQVVRKIILVVLLVLVLAGSVSAPVAENQQVRRFTRTVEFDYIAWMLEALLQKNAFSSLNMPRYLTDAQQREIVEAYIALVRQGNQLERQIADIFADPQIADPTAAAADLLSEQARLDERIERWGRMSEAIIQHQISVVLKDLGFEMGGQPIPPPLYKVTPLPLALIVSPRDVIRQDANISLLPDLSLGEITALETQVERELGVSALVVSIGGVGVYPTMVMRTTDLPWLVDVVAHEWSHNYLTLRPLGALYYASSELRTMNETTASIVGREVGRAVIRRFYPEHQPAPGPAAPHDELFPPPEDDSQPGVFNFQEQMHITRVTVDRMLAEGEVEEAEAYMNARQAFFYEHGYRIRRLNQAYFAFHGAYADSPRGAAGRDPVGALVRALRARSSSLKDFIDSVAWMTSMEQLAEAVRQPNVE